LPIIQKFVGVYKIWQEFLPNFQKTSRYTLCLKIDALFIEIIELLFIASYSAGDKKLN